MEKEVSPEIIFMSVKGRNEGKTENQEPQEKWGKWEKQEFASLPVFGWERPRWESVTPPPRRYFEFTSFFQEQEPLRSFSPLRALPFYPKPPHRPRELPPSHTASLGRLI